MSASVCLWWKDTLTMFFKVINAAYTPFKVKRSKSQGVCATKDGITSSTAVMVATARITEQHGSFNRIRQVAPLCSAVFAGLTVVSDNKWARCVNITVSTVRIWRCCWRCQMVFCRCKIALVIIWVKHHSQTNISTSLQNIVLGLCILLSVLG